MNIRNILIIAVLGFPASVAFGQATSPAPVGLLAYHFKAGEVLHYKKIDEFRNPDNPPGLNGTQLGSDRGYSYYGRER